MLEWTNKKRGGVEVVRSSEKIKPFEDNNGGYHESSKIVVRLELQEHVIDTIAKKIEWIAKKEALIISRHKELIVKDHLKASERTQKVKDIISLQLLLPSVSIRSKERWIICLKL